MKYLSCILLLLAIQISAQETFIDPRDQKSYSITTIKGVKWMTGNLDYETPLSKSIEDIDREPDPRLRGRWYHLHETENICPDGWRLPTAHDWVHYIDFVTSQKAGSYKIKSYQEDIQVKKFDKYVSLFEKDNPLNLISTGIFEGGKYRYPMGYQADYWIEDLPTVNDEIDDLGFNPVKKVYEGKSHIHLHDPFTQIHSHEHHLDPKDEETIRLFMVRCVCEENEN